MYDELVKLLRECYEADSCGECPYFPKGGDCGDMTKRAADAIEALSAKVPQWIPVEERPPEDCVEVIVAFKYNTGVIDVTTGILEDGEWYLDDDEMSVQCTVTHWMPLPEPPKDHPAPICQTCGNFETCPWRHEGVFSGPPYKARRVLACSDYKPE